MLDTLPNELLLWIADQLDSERDLNAFARVDRCTFSLRNPYSYRRNAREGNSTALLWAAQHGSEPTARRALSAGADVNARSAPTSFAPAINSTFEDGWTPLALAAMHNQERMIHLLLTVPGVDVNLRSDNWGKAPLTLAVQTTNAGIAQALLEDARVDPELLDRQNKTPLMHAAWIGDVEIVQLLLAHEEVGVMTMNTEGKTALWYAVENGKEDATRLLLQVGADPHQPVGVDPITLAVSKAHGGIVGELLAAPLFDRSLLNPTLEQPLCNAARNGHMGLVSAILSYDRRVVGWHPGDGRNALWWARAGGHSEIVNLLIARGSIDP